MKKGDDRRQQIIEAGERLFYERGYEATSVQDILDELKLSKGGFYHHFESKLTLLSAICELRAEDSRRSMERAVDECEGSAVDKLNALFMEAGLLQGGNMDFLGLLLRVAYRGDGVLLRYTLKEATIRGALPLINGIIFEGIEQKLFASRYPDDIGELLLNLFVNLTDDVADLLANKPGDMQAILSKLEIYRYSVELLLNAPYGSMVLFDMGRMEGVLKAVAEQDRRFGA